MTKAEYREYFAQCKDFIKFNKFIKECGICQPCFSRFMSNELFDYQISIEKLDQLYNSIKAEVNKIA